MRTPSSPASTASPPASSTGRPRYIVPDEKLLARGYVATRVDSQADNPPPQKHFLLPTMQDFINDIEDDKWREKPTAWHNDIMGKVLDDGRVITDDHEW